MVRIWNCKPRAGKVVAFVPLEMWESWAGKGKWSTIDWIRLN